MLDFDLTPLQGFPEFLALAEAFRKLGESTTAQGQSVPVLNPEETWLSPPDLLLPQIEVDLPPLSPETLGLLAARRAPRRTP